MVVGGVQLPPMLLTKPNNMTREFTIDEAKQYAINRKKSTRFYFNVYGWNRYLTLRPTFATPSGRLKGFPRAITIKVNSDGSIQPVAY